VEVVLTPEQEAETAAKKAENDRRAKAVPVNVMEALLKGCMQNDEVCVCMCVLYVAVL